LIIATCNFILALCLITLCITRLLKDPRHYALNPIIHFCLFVAIYIGIGSFLLSHTATKAFSLSLDTTSIINAQVIGFLMQITAFGMLVVSRSSRYYCIYLKRQSFFNILITISVLYVLVLTLVISTKIPSNILFLERVVAHEIYLENFGSMKLNTILYVLLVIYALNIYSYNRLLFLALFALALIPLVHGSRNLMFALLWINFFLYLSTKVRFTSKLFLHPSLLSIIFLSGMWFFLSFPGLDLGAEAIFYKFFAEAGNTAVALAWLIDNYTLSSERESLMHLLIMILPFFKAINDNNYFAHIINDEIIQAPYSLAANFLAEFYYYFDFLGFILLPIYTILFFKIISIKNLFFLIWSISCVCVMRVAIRGSLIEAFASAFSYALVIYALILIFGPKMRRVS
jgi:hypothetical protein